MTDEDRGVYAKFLPPNTEIPKALVDLHDEAVRKYCALQCGQLEAASYLMVYMLYRQTCQDQTLEKKKPVPEQKPYVPPPVINRNPKEPEFMAGDTVKLVTGPGRPRVGKFMSDLGDGKALVAVGSGQVKVPMESVRVADG